MGKFPNLPDGAFNSGSCFSEKAVKFPNYLVWRHQLLDFQGRHPCRISKDIFRIGRMAPQHRAIYFPKRLENFRK